MVGGQASGKRKAEHFEPLDLREGKSPSHSKQTNEHSAPLFVRKQAQGPKWYLRGEKKKKSRAYISRTQCQELIYFQQRSLLIHFPWLGAHSTMLGTSGAFRTGLHSLLATGSTQLLKELEACLGPLPILSSKCQTGLGECQAGSANGEHRRDGSRQLHGAGLE